SLFSALIEAVEQVLNNQAIQFRARRAPGVKIIALFLKLFQGPERVIPGAKIVQLAPDLFCPSPCPMREKREIRIGLFGSVARIFSPARAGVTGVRTRGAKGGMKAGRQRSRMSHWWVLLFSTHLRPGDVARVPGALTPRHQTSGVKRVSER